VTAPEGGWRYNIGGFERAHPGWALWSDGLCYIARRRSGGRLSGPLVRATTLDELGAAIDAAEIEALPRWKD
jgi:hypothetical protein